MSRPRSRKSPDKPSLCYLRFPDGSLLEVSVFRRCGEALRWMDEVRLLDAYRHAASRPGQKPIPAARYRRSRRSRRSGRRR